MDYSRENALSALVELLEGNRAEPGEVTKLITDYPEHREELRDLIEIWRSFKEIDTPKLRPEMDAAFYKMLSQETAHIPKTGKAQGAFIRSLKQGVTWVIQPKRLMIAAAFFIGILCGRFVFLPNADSDMENLALDTPKPTFSTLVSEGTAVERLESIQSTKSMEDPNDLILEALYKALIYDSNVNVRLSAIEAMARFADHPKVTEYLINSIGYQDSPIVQLELAELMIVLEEKGSAEAWNNLLQSDELDVDVRLQLKEKLATIL